MGNYGKIFPKLHELYRSAETLSLDYTDEENRKRPHSEYTLYCVGFDGSVTGRTRAHNILYADDLVKDIEEASNTEIMNKKWVEFTGTIKKRMQGRCKMLLVGTMFSINDPLSRTIKYYEEHEPERLIQIRIPGLNEKDESNFNYKYGYAITTEMFHEDRDLMDPVSFSCLIQQNPIERAGLLFFEEEFKKYDLRTYERNELEYERTVAACDVAWGGDDHLSLPIIDEYKNGECILRHWLFVQGSKDETIPKVVEAIITYGVTYVCFEANNGGDMYADAVEKELKKRGHVCYVTSAKSPTNKSKLDRILAAQGFIKGADASEYRLVIPIRESIRGDKQFNEALNEVFAFNQSTAKNVRTKQHDDSCFEAGTKISTLYGDKNIEDIKVGDKIITPFGIDEVEKCGCTGEKETIYKFGTKVTPTHKYFSKNGLFESVDTLTGLPKNGKMCLKELIKWKYKKLLSSMELSTNLWGRESIISANQIQMKEEDMRKDCMWRFGNFITKKKYQKGIMFIIKTVILLITTFLTWSVYQLGNICHNKRRKIGKIQNIERQQKKDLRKFKKKQKNGTKVKKEEHGIENMQKNHYCVPKSTNIFVKNVEKNIGIQEKLKQDFAVLSVPVNIIGEKKKKRSKVYNLKIKKYGCYYANGNLVSNCDSLSMLAINVLGVDAKVGKAVSTISRDMLGI